MYQEQLTAKTINHVNDDELEKRLQTLTELIIHRQTIIETLQIDKSSLECLDDYEIITTRNSSQQSFKISPSPSIPMDDHEQYENLRYRMPLLRERPYDIDLTKKAKRAASQFGNCLTIFLRHYPFVFVLFFM
jgi:hypothetical protein